MYGATGMTATQQTYMTDLRDNPTTYATTPRDKVLGENIAVFIRSKNMRFNETCNVVPKC